MSMGSSRKREVALDELMPLFRQTLAEGRSVCFAPRGVSMLPMLRQGMDTVTISPIEGKLKKYDLPLYQRDNGKYVLHRVVRVADTYTCLGDNQFHKEPGIRQDQIIGVMTEFTRGEQRIPVTDWRYRCYCVLWSWTRFPRRCWRKGMRILKKLFA